MARLPKLLPGAEGGFVALLHTAMVQLGSYLIKLSGDSSDLGVLPKDWAHKGPDNYAFRCKHGQSSSVLFELKMYRLGNRTLLDVTISEARHFLHLYWGRFFVRIIQHDKFDPLDISNDVVFLQVPS